MADTHTPRSERPVAKLQRIATRCSRRGELFLEDVRGLGETFPVVAVPLSGQFGRNSHCFLVAKGRNVVPGQTLGFVVSAAYRP